MTTAAPPEKMTLESCVRCGNGFATDILTDPKMGWNQIKHFVEHRCRDNVRITTPHFMTKEEAARFWNREFAARRLSAPAPAAPRVGDDATGLEQWTDAEAIAGLRSDAADIHGRRLHMLANRMRDAAARIERLSAPPAASAEREDEAKEIALVIAQVNAYYGPSWEAAEMLQRLGYRKLAPAQSVGQSAAQGVGWQTVARAICAETCAFKGEPACYEVTDNMGEPLPWPAPACDEPGCEWLAKRVLSAGYRKLAPAQSVGQSAAQGVFVPQSVWDWLMGEGDSFVDPEPPHPKYKRNFWWRKELRKRLSALPKGQEHEG